MRQLADENRRLNQRIASQETAQVQGAWNGFLDAVASVQIPRLNSYITQSLHSVKAQYQGPIYDTLADRFGSDVREMLANDPHYLREVDPFLNRINQTKAFMNGSAPELARQVAQIQDRHLQRIIPPLRQRFLASLRGPAGSTQTPTAVTAPPAAVSPQPGTGPAPSSPQLGGIPQPGIPSQQPQRFTVQPNQDVMTAIESDVTARIRQAVANAQQGGRRR
jgi:hypothetical protein